MLLQCSSFIYCKHCSYLVNVIICYNAVSNMEITTQRKINNRIRHCSRIENVEKHFFFHALLLCNLQVTPQKNLFVA